MPTLSHLIPTRSFIPIATAALLLAGCTVGPKYSAPSISQSTASALSSSPGIPTAPTPIEWWRTFHDPLLDRLISQVSTHNLDLRRSRSRLLEARALWTRARFDLWPSTRATGQFEKSQISEDAAGIRDRHTQFYRAGFDASWELDLWGAVRSNNRAAKATIESVEADLAHLNLSLQAELAANYFELRGIQGNLEVSSRNATNQGLTLNLAIALRDGGQGTQLDVARARSLHNETLASSPPLELAHDRALHRISVLCGLPPSQIRPELTPQAPIPKAGAWTAPGDPSTWIRRRPDIRAAERSLAAATARIGVQSANLFPRVTFNGSIGLQARSIGALPDQGSDTFGFGPQITWAALDLGRVRQQVKAAGARAAQALDAYEQTVLLALEETENSLVALNRERERLGYLTEAEHSASEAATLARQRYRDGIADYLSVLDSERTLLNLQEQLVRAQTQVNTRLVAVFKALATSVE